MSLLERVLRALCPHRFSWPRIGVDGRDYQVCLICGTAYAYDWSTMRRTSLLTPVDSPAGVADGSKHP